MTENSKSNSFVLFVWRIASFCLVLTFLAIVYTLMEGDLQYLTGMQSSGNGTQIAEEKVNPEIQEYRANKPTMGTNIFRFASDSANHSENTVDTAGDSNDTPYDSKDNNGTDSVSPMTPIVSPETETVKEETGSETSSSAKDTLRDMPPVISPLADVQDSTTDFSQETSSGIVSNDPTVSTHGAVITGPDGVPRRGEVVVQEGGLPNLKNLEGPPVTDFLELFSFDITPDWVEARWSNVTIVGPLTTRGYRVPLSTGPTESDIFGSLTYYFNNRLELEKITFEGYTGNLDRLVISLRYFNMSKRVTADPNALLYVSEVLADNRQSFLKTYHRLLPIEEGNPMKKYWITMELYPPER